MRVWTIANQKGGVGKTTTTVALGGLLADRGKRVLLVDIDPHASLTYYFGIDSEHLELSAFDVFTQNAGMTAEQFMQALQPTAVKNLDVLPSTMALATLDRKLGTQSGMGLILKKALHQVRQEYDYVLIDVPPVLGVLMVNAIAACQRILIPVQTEFLALKGLERMMRTLTLIANSRQQQHPYTIVPTLYDRRTNASMQAHQRLRELYGEHVWNGMIPVDTKFRDASRAQQVPSQFAPKSRGVLAYQSLLTHVLQLDKAGERL
ncbi:ParA family protein [Idiomarina xiamenensis]|uniref:Soj family ATPase n=1 Tax=Idiomarina xiamenensis 10-D-4 TaxID=740709 RepID=K2K2A3_9GAMM|nr:ParA family protein [Idiomarina xiamenensis]EKE80817.1 Soj family ATPase [Idiomarina xiamenensis 10-D-4]